MDNKVLNFYNKNKTLRYRGTTWTIDSLTLNKYGRSEFKISYWDYNQFKGHRDQTIDNISADWYVNTWLENDKR